MAAANSTFDEPELAVKVQARRFSERGFLWTFLPATLLGILGVISLLVSGNVFLPFDQVTTLDGRVGQAWAAYFDDDQVFQILMKHKLVVDVNRSGGWEINPEDIDGYDFAMPSGQSMANLLVSGAEGPDGAGATAYKPFVSPLVLASYREYAETLVDAGVAERKQYPGLPSLAYYELDTERFFDLIGSGKTWDSLGVQRHGIENSNRVVAQTSRLCNSSPAVNYLGIVTFLQNGGRVPQGEQETDRLADKVRPLLAAPELPSADMFGRYRTPMGKRVAPIVVAPEGQYLSYQLETQKMNGGPDPSRVPLYLSGGFDTAPQLISFGHKADRLGELLVGDPELRQRAIELGYRIPDPGDTPSGGQLSRSLGEHTIQAPLTAGTETEAYLPPSPLLERLVSNVGGCP